jgi:3-deoxy-D-manno-octulosonic-acid transferase
MFNLYVVQTVTSILRPVISFVFYRKYLSQADRRKLARQRRGLYQVQRPTGPLVWLHAASIGEMKSALPLIENLCGDYRILFTTATTSSHKLLQYWLREKKISQWIISALNPVDVPAWNGRFLDWWSPSIMISIESEIWPNLLIYCRDRSIPAILLNGRLSLRSFLRWRLVAGTFKVIASSFSAIQARSFADCARFQLLGGGGALMVASDLKFMAPPLDYNAIELQRLAPSVLCRPVWLAASTHPGEEGIILQVHEALCGEYPDLISIIVPRHPERGADLSRQLGARRRSLGKASPEAGIWIADTYGELGLWYRMIPIVFVGRSLIPKGGGQNMLEPARVGCTLVVGTETANFVDHMRILRESNTVQEVGHANELRDFVSTMLEDSYFRRK